MTNNHKVLRIIQLLNEKQQILNAPKQDGGDAFTTACQEEAELHYIDEEIQQLRRR